MSVRFLASHVREEAAEPLSAACGVGRVLHIQNARLIELSLTSRTNSISLRRNRVSINRFMQVFFSKIIITRSKAYIPRSLAIVCRVTEPRNKIFVDQVSAT